MSSRQSRKIYLMVDYEGDASCAFDTREAIQKSIDDDEDNRDLLHIEEISFYENGDAIKEAVEREREEILKIITDSIVSEDGNIFNATHNLALWGIIRAIRARSEANG